MLTLRPGPNVELVFTKIPNVVSCSQTLLLLLLLFTRKMAKGGCSSQNFARAASGGAHNQIKNVFFLSTKCISIFDEMLSVHVSSDGPKTSHFQSHRAKISQIRVVLGSV